MCAHTCSNQQPYLCTKSNGIRLHIFCVLFIYTALTFQIGFLLFCNSTGLEWTLSEKKLSSTHSQKNVKKHPLIFASWKMAFTCLSISVGLENVSCVTLENRVHKYRSARKRLMTMSHIVTDDNTDYPVSFPFGSGSSPWSQSIVYYTCRSPYRLLLAGMLVCSLLFPENTM